jgi:hypothetical protein
MPSGTCAALAWWLIAAMQLSGVFAACLVRSSARDGLARSVQALFLALLCIAAVTTVVALSISPTTWFFSSASLSAMVLVAIVDFGGPREGVAEH